MDWTFHHRILGRALHSPQLPRPWHSSSSFFQSVETRIRPGSFSRLICQIQRMPRLSIRTNLRELPAPGNFRLLNFQRLEQGGRASRSSCTAGRRLSTKTAPHLNGTVHARGCNYQSNKSNAVPMKTAAVTSSVSERHPTFTPLVRRPSLLGTSQTFKST